MKMLLRFAFLLPLFAFGAAADRFISAFKSDELCVEAADGVGLVVAEDDVVGAMRLGWWACAEKLAESAAASGLSPDMASVVALEARAIAGKLSALRSALESALPPSNIITPAFQWAQSPDSLFLNVKFSHKLDAPATLGVSVDSLEFTNDTIKLRVRLVSSSLPHSPVLASLLIALSCLFPRNHLLRLALNCSARLARRPKSAKPSSSTSRCAAPWCRPSPPGSPAWAAASRSR
jgi:hypothetical protein